MIINNPQGSTFNQLAAAMTIGGSAYGLALARYNNYSDATAVPTGSITIPDDWIIGAPVLVGTPPPTPSTPAIIPGVSNTALLIGAGIVMALLAISR